MNTKSTLTPAEAKQAVGRFAKVNGPASFYYGQITDVDLSGNYLLFYRGKKYKSKWYHRSDVSP
jgi:hypothetical protein